MIETTAAFYNGRRPASWDVTVPDTNAESHIANIAITPGAAAHTFIIIIIN